MSWVDVDSVLPHCLGNLVNNALFCSLNSQAFFNLSDVI